MSRHLLLPLLLVAACRTASEAPPPAPPPAGVIQAPLSMEELQKRRLQSLMGKLAVHLMDVNALLGEPTLTAENRQEIARHLGEVDLLAVAIAEEPETRRHPGFSSFFPAFAMMSRKARSAATREPASYTEVGEMMQVCIACHAATRP